VKESQDLLSDNFRIGYLEEYAGQSSIFTTETLDYRLTTIKLTNAKTDCISHQVFTKCEIHLIEMNGSAWKCSKSTDFTLETGAECTADRELSSLTLPATISQTTVRIKSGRALNRATPQKTCINTPCIMV